MGLLLGGYLLVWTAFGIAVHLGDRGLHALVEGVPWFNSRAWLLAVTALAGAGLYQFSELKYRCLDQCRSPLMFVAQRWTGRNERARSFRKGSRRAPRPRPGEARSRFDPEARIVLYTPTISS